MDDGCRKKMQIFLSDGQNIRGFLLAETSKMSIWKNPTASTVQSLRSATYSWVGSRRLVFLFSAPSPEQEFPATNRTLFICWLVHKIQNKFFLETLLDRPTYTELPRNRTLFTDSINPSWRVMTSSMANLESLMTSPVGIFGNDWRKPRMNHETCCSFPTVLTKDGPQSLTSTKKQYPRRLARLKHEFKTESSTRQLLS